MSFIDEFKGAIQSMFASYTDVTQATQIEMNPISTALENMNTKPKFKTIDGFEYLTFGKNDDVDLMIDRVMYKSSTHSGIVTKKAKMITGSGLSVNSQLIGTKDAKLNTLIKHAGGAGTGLYTLMTKTAFEYTKSGAVGVICDFGKPKDGKSVPDGIIKMTIAPSRNIRLAKPKDGSDNYTEIVYKKSFKQGAEVPDAELIPIFDPFAKQTRAILYIRNPYSTLDTYGVPSWIGAFNFIEADYEFGVTIENSAKNGFAPKTHVTMFGRNMSKEERRTAAENIQTRLSGSKGDSTVVSFVAKKDEAPIIDAVGGSNLDKTIDTMSRLNDAKILTAHNITSPTLFGVMTTGQTMGGTGTEMLSSFNLFKATETIPDRKIIIDGFASLFEATELKDVEFDIIEEDVAVDFKTKPVEGGNTEDNPDTKTVGKKSGDKKVTKTVKKK